MAGFGCSPRAQFKGWLQKSYPLRTFPIFRHYTQEYAAVGYSTMGPAVEHPSDHLLDLYALARLNSTETATIQSAPRTVPGMPGAASPKGQLHSDLRPAFKSRTSKWC